MGYESPNVTLIDSAGNILPVQNATAIPASTPGLLVLGSDGTNSRYLAVDSSGRQIIVGTASDNTTNSTTKLPVLPARANTSAPTWTDGNMVPLSVDTSGALRITGSISATNPSVGSNAATPPTSSTLIGGSVTTSAPIYTTGQLNALSLTTSGLLRVDGSGVTQPVSGTVTANIGTSGSLALDSSLSDGTQRTRITDGTNNAAVTASGVSPNLTDSALVVNISPNKPATYSASAIFAAANTPTDVFTIAGSASKTISVQKIIVTATQTTAAVRDILLIRRSAANTGGTSTAVTKVSHDTTNPAATATVLSYTANPTALGTSVGTMLARKVFIGTTTSLFRDSLTINLGSIDDQGITLRGTSQLLCINLNGVTSTGNSFAVYVEWTEL